MKKSEGVWVLSECIVDLCCLKYVVFLSCEQQDLCLLLFCSDVWVHRSISHQVSGHFRPIFLALTLFVLSVFVSLHFVLIPFSLSYELLYGFPLCCRLSAVVCPVLVFGVFPSTFGASHTLHSLVSCTAFCYYILISMHARYMEITSCNLAITFFLSLPLACSDY